VRHPTIVHSGSGTIGLLVEDGSCEVRVGP